MGANEDRLASIALQLVARVHDDVPLANGMWLTANTSEEDRWALLFILAAAVPTDRPWSELTSWVRFGDLSEFGDGRPDTPEKIAARREEWTRRAA